MCMIKKIIYSIFIAMILCTSFNLWQNRSYASLIGDYKEEADQKAEEEAAKKEEEEKGVSRIYPGVYKPPSFDRIEGGKVAEMGNLIIGVLRVIGTVISVVVLVVLGLKYMIGSAEERADYKKSMIPYVIGAVIVFAITNLLGIIIDLTQALLKY